MQWCLQLTNPVDIKPPSTGLTLKFHTPFRHKFVQTEFENPGNLPWRVCCDDDDRKGHSSGQCKAPGMTTRFSFFIRSVICVWETSHQDHLCEMKVFTVMKTKFHIIPIITNYKHESRPAEPALPWLWSHWIRCNNVQIENDGCLTVFTVEYFRRMKMSRYVVEFLPLEHVPYFSPIHKCWFLRVRTSNARTSNDVMVAT